MVDDGMSSNTGDTESGRHGPRRGKGVPICSLETNKNRNKKIFGKTPNFISKNVKTLKKLSVKEKIYFLRVGNPGKIGVLHWRRRSMGVGTGNVPTPTSRHGAPIRRICRRTPSTL